MDKLLKFEESLKKAILEKGDEQALESYVKLKSINKLQLWYDYLKIFAFCQALEITNLYDIGCGNLHQALLLSSFSNISYTGIDSEHDFRNLTALFSEFSSHIKFQQAEYPFEITPPSNNIAISQYALGALTQMQKSDDSIKNTARALSKDFERILITINPECFSIWEAELADFNLHILGYDALDGKLDGSIPTVFATKFPEEINQLIQNQYNYYNNEYIIDFIVL